MTRLDRLRLTIVACLLGGFGPAFAVGRTDELNRLAQSASCLIEATSIVKLSSQAQGVLAKVRVKRGDLVQAGQVVAELESSVEAAELRAYRFRAEMDSIIRSKKAELAGSEKKLARQRTLATTQIASAQTLEIAETDVSVLRAQVKQAEMDRELAGIEADRMSALYERRILRSPVTGIVASVDHYAGEYADSSTVITTLAEVGVLRVEVYLPLAAYLLIEVGMTANVKPIGPIDGTFAARVSSKDRQIDAASNLFQVQLELPNPRLVIPAGLRCAVDF